MNIRVSTALLIISIASTIAAGTETFDGYTFVYSNNKAYLYDMNKTIINTWTTQKQIMYCADLLRDSSVIIAMETDNNNFKYNQGAGTNGRFQILNWNGDVVWDYTYVGPEHWPHHDIEPVYRTNDPKEKPTFLIPCFSKCGDNIVELKPTGKNTAEVLWEWSASDHICQTGCTDKADVLYLYAGGSGSSNIEADLMHTNNISYNRRLDQIVISCKGYNELFVIDHSTTTAEAKTSSGGKSGKGGGILYRWGHPSNYVSDALHDVLLHQHHCCWIPDTMPGTSLPMPGGGNFMAFNSVEKTVVEISNPFRDGNYSRNRDNAFDPTSVLWSYKDTTLQGNEGSIQKLPNNNYLICTGGVYFAGEIRSDFTCKVLEVAPDPVSGGRIVWELSGFGVSGEAYRYAYSYLNGSATSAENSGNSPTVIGSVNLTSFVHDGHVFISANSGTHKYSVSVYGASGRMVLKNVPPTASGTWDLGNISGGIYIVTMSSGKGLISQRVQVRK